MLFCSKKYRYLGDESSFRINQSIHPPLNYLFGETNKYFELGICKHLIKSEILFWTNRFYFWYKSNASKY